MTSTSVLASSPAALRFESEDWTSFRTIEGLQRRGGVSEDKLTRLVLKELADDALDTKTDVRIGETSKGYFVEDDGPGLPGTPKDIAYLYSIGRQMVSTKSLRLPQRGALGNGLRVVAGAVLVSGGTLNVTTRNRRIRLRPEPDGTTTVLDVKPVKHPVGTRVEISFGRALPSGAMTLSWAKRACLLATGKSYDGQSSPWWYNAPQFYQLMISTSDNVTVRKLMEQLDGSDRADVIIAKAGLAGNLRCKNVTEKQAKKLLVTARAHIPPVSPAQLGAIGAHLLLAHAYACTYGFAVFGVDEPKARVPYAVEAWARSTTNDTYLQASINATPMAGDIHASRDKRDIDFFGCGLHHTMAQQPKEEQFDIWLNIISPYVPYTSDGKEPDLQPFLRGIQTAVSKAVRKAHKPKRTFESDALLPKRRRGRQTPEADEAYRVKVKEFCRLIRQIHSSLDFGVGSRDYCYLLESHGLGKGDFDAAEKIINDCRKSGDLPLDICAEDASRDAIGLETIDSCKDVSGKADTLIDNLLDRAPKEYLPISFWDDLNIYIEVATEKLSLRNLFEPVCKKFHIPVTNFKGWSDLNSRAAMMRRFKLHEAAGRTCILLICGDHDPGGLLITQTLRKNLADLSKAVGWSPTNLILIRFGLNADFIDDNDLTWIDNLETSSGGRLDDESHNDHHKAYVQDYIAEHGARKCEANALVVVPDIGRQLCRDAILEHISIDAVRRYERRLARFRKDLKDELQTRLGLPL